MKRLRIYLTVCAFILGIPTGSFAADPKVDAKTVAAYVQTFYDQTKSVAASFYQTYYYKLYQRYERSKGEVLFVKPGKMLWNYAKPNGKKILANSKSLQIFEPGEEGSAGQLFEQDMKNAQLPKAMSFLTGTSRLADDFHFRLLESASWKFNGYVLELRPQKPDPNFDRILFFVDADPSRRGVVHRVLIIDHSGNRNKFEFSKLKFNKPVPTNTFAWKPPKGTRRIKP
ncbi:MAG: outer membrane lipoprotein carrier protein LolA [Myxococcales bacterium]|nr:MAG: outer membrane lipoprotein carrier protein LolA [Myxococcales bacterium]